MNAPSEVAKLLEEKLQALNALESRVAALRAEANELWASRSGMIEIIEAFQIVFQYMNHGNPHPSAQPTVVDALEPDPDDDVAQIPGHITSLDMNAMAKDVIPETPRVARRARPAHVPRR